MASKRFDLLAYMHREVLVASFLALCPRVDGLCPVIISCLENAEIIINAISTFCIGICLPSTSLGNPQFADQISLPNIWQSRTIALKRSSARADSNH
jgi:hypothetical protein